MFRHATMSLGCLSLACSMVGILPAEDWTRFRGPGGTGVSPTEQSLPVEWSDTKNLKWKAALPGPGGSSPIIVGEKVFVTCWSGYGTDQRDPGDQKGLKRHLICLDRATGKTLWDKTVDAVLPEDVYRGMFAEHGYATHTPVSDGEGVYVFFGKTGVVAFDMEGNQRWQTSVGTNRDQRGWGSSSSPILYKNLVIVTASVESQSLIALDKESGKEVWRQEADGFGSTWGTPILVDLPDGEQELVLGVPYEIWGFHPDSGKLKWYCEGPASNSMCSSVVAQDGIIYAIESGPGGGGAVAVRAGGKGDVTQSHQIWSTRDRSRVATPIVHDGHLYWINSKIANCIDIKDGKRVYQERLSSSRSSSSDQRGSQRGRRSGGRGGQDYSSPICADGKIYYTTRSGETYVLKVGAKFEELGKNRLGDGDEVIATPAVSNGCLFLRSNKFLYCIAKDSE